MERQTNAQSFTLVILVETFTLTILVGYKYFITIIRHCRMNSYRVMRSNTGNTANYIEAHSLSWFSAQSRTFWTRDPDGCGPSVFLANALIAAFPSHLQIRSLSATYVLSNRRSIYTED